MTSNFHKSVLGEAIIENFKINRDGIYVDATIGRGGHAKLILDKLGSNGKLIGIDQDETAIDFCQRLFQNDSRVTIIKNNFVNLKSILTALKIESVDGIIMDLGVSSPQLDNPERGFSYHHDGPLDMRMNQNQNLTAFEIINTYSQEKLITIFKKYGEVSRPMSVVQGIIKARDLAPITTTTQLSDLIKAHVSAYELNQKKHFARRYFQALRIAVNNELSVLESTIEVAARLLNKEGILQIISFHSLEDKIVLDKFKKLSVNYLPKEIPIFSEDFQDFKIVNKLIVPNEVEIKDNNRARSARLRILQRIRK